MYFSIFLIIAGTFWLFINNGWTLNFGLTWSFFWPVVVILAGLVSLLKSRNL